MNALRKANVIVIRPLTAVVSEHRRTVARPVLRATWRVSIDTGRLECTWTDTTASDIPYSYAA